MTPSQQTIQLIRDAIVSGNQQDAENALEQYVKQKTMNKQKFERIVKITPAYDKRTTGHGIHNATLYMCLKGELGAVIFSTGTNWYLKETDAWLEQCNMLRPREKEYRPRGNAVCYCSPKPLMEFQMNEGGRENCDWLGCTCWGDCSYSTSDEVVNILVSEGSEGVWKWLEDWYEKTLVQYNNEAQTKSSETLTQ